MLPAMKGVLRSLFLAAVLCVPSVTASADVEAHPAFWVIHGKSGGTAYVLSSVHVLPAGVDWHDREIDAAIKDSDTFVFEVPETAADENEATRFIVARGLLPEGQTLKSLLSPAAQKDYAQACSLAGLKTECLSDKRPWLAAVVLTVSYMNQRNLVAENTPDEQLMRFAVKYGKDIRYFDTTEQQLEILAQFDRTMGVGGFSTLLGDFQNQPQREDALLAAWRAGDTDTLNHLIDTSFAADPEARKLVDAHSRIWAAKLEDLLSTSRTYFVTVGVAHLVGPAGVPALLRADGYKVDGP